MFETTSVSSSHHGNPNPANPANPDTMEDLHDQRLIMAQKMIPKVSVELWPEIPEKKVGDITFFGYLLTTFITTNHL